MSSLVLSLRGVSKAFGAVQALRDVSVDCRAGEIHALVGENGSGKSTLLGIASGFVQPDEGAVEIGGSRRRRGSPAEARRLGLGMAYQTYSHVLDLSVAENLYLAAPGDEQPAYGRMEEWAAERLAEFELDVPPTAPAGSLSLAERQLLEVVKALLARPKVLLLDEPTTALGPEEVERLHALVFEQSRAGVGIVYVSHRLPEVLGIADRITVLRDGVCQGTFEAAGDVGGEPRRADDRPAAPARLSRSGTAPGPSARCSSPSRAFEASGSGRSTSRSRRARSSGSPAPRATGRCSSCVRSPAPSARPAARPATATSSTRGRRSAPLRAGVVLLSGDRARESLFPVLSVRANTTIQVLRRLGRLGFINRRRERRTVDELVRRLGIRMASIEQPVQSLSGGNQQKVSLTRPFLRGDVKVILAEEPTQGVDVAARFDIYDALRAKAKEGVADHRQVERSARARRALRPRRRDVARDDRRRDPRRRARRAPDRRGDRRRASRCPARGAADGPG